MIQQRSLITTKLLGFAIVIASLVPAFAHEGFNHVIGTVAAVSATGFSVKTTKGNVDVKFDGKTEFSRGDAKALPSDLKPGVRVVVDIPEESKTGIAHSVKLGAAAAAHK